MPPAGSNEIKFNPHYVPTPASDNSTDAQRQAVHVQHQFQSGCGRIGRSKLKIASAQTEIAKSAFVAHSRIRNRADHRVAIAFVTGGATALGFIRQEFWFLIGIGVGHGQSLSVVIGQDDEIFIVSRRATYRSPEETGCVRRRTSWSTDQARVRGVYVVRSA